MASTTTVKTLVIKAGDTGVIKSTAKILSVGVFNGAQAESNCVNVDEALSTPEAYACYELVWEGDNRSSGSGSWEDDGVTFDQIEVDGTVYPINIITSDTAGIAAKIKLSVPPSIMTFGNVVNGQAFYYDEDNEKTRHDLCFLTLPSLAEKIRARLSNSRLDDGSLPVPTYYIYARPLSTETGGWCSCPDSIAIS